MFDILRDAPSSPPRAREAASSAAGVRELSSSEPRHNMIPPFDVDFWRVYGNKLRCYGTQEEVCDLTGKLRQVTGMGRTIMSKVRRAQQILSASMSVQVDRRRRRSMRRWLRASHRCGCWGWRERYEYSREALALYYYIS